MEDALIGVSEHTPAPQDVLDILCVLCFRHRAHLLADISDHEPFDVNRAQQIANRLTGMVNVDPKAALLGENILNNWNRFNNLA